MPEIKQNAVARLASCALAGTAYVIALTYNETPVTTATVAALVTVAAVLAVLSFAPTWRR